MVKIVTPNGYTVKAEKVEEAVNTVKQLEQVEIEFTVTEANTGSRDTGLLLEPCPICESDNVGTFDYNEDILICRDCGITY